MIHPPKSRAFLKKSLNLLQVVAGYLLSRIFHQVVCLGKPIGVTVEPTNHCNLKCPECPSGQGILTRPKGYISEELFEKIVNDLGKNLFYLTFFFQGEPYLHPGFPGMIKSAASAAIPVWTSTNGHFLTPENVRSTIDSGLYRMVISLDGTDQDAYMSYRVGGSFDKVVEGIREIVMQKKKAGTSRPFVVLQFLVLRTNEHQVDEIRSLGKRLGVDKVELKPAQFYDFAGGNPLIPENPTYSRYIAEEDASGRKAWRLKNRMPDHCFRMWSSCVVTWDGWVVPCCYDKDAKYRMGNINDEPFEKIWNGKKYNEFRHKVLRSRKSIDICSNCPEGIGLMGML